jgi:predicted nucleotidyltransferase
MAAESGTWGERALGELLGSRARAKVLAHVCTQPPGVPIVAANVARGLGLAPNAAWVELERLRRLGVLEVRERLGRTKPYYVNERCPLLPGLRSVVQYAVGVVGLLRDQLAQREDVDAAFMYGSVAAGDDRPASDVDVMVIGGIRGRDLSAALRRTERLTRRRVNEVCYSREEFARRAREGGSFVPTVLQGPKLFLKGDEDALRELAG